MTTSVDDTLSTAKHTPRLSIFHLMLWTLCSAVYLTLIRAIYSLQEMPDNVAAMQRASSLLQGIINGAVLTGAIVLVYSRYRTGPPLLKHPGHWLLLVAAVVTVVILPLFLLLQLLDNDLLQLLENGAVFLLYAVVFIAPAIAYLFAVRYTKPVRWRILFGALAVLGVLKGLAYAGIWFNLYSLWSWSALEWGPIFLSGWIVVVSILDLKAGQRRDWLHWIGVACYLADTGITLIWMIGTQFI